MEATEFISINSLEEMHRYARSFGALLPAKAVVAFFGDLGVGKTTFIRGLTEGISGIDSREVSSPTFGFLHIYQGAKTVFHFDLYRLPSEKEFLLSGFDEYLDSDGICCIEWAEKIPTLLPKDCLQVHIQHRDELTRLVTIKRRADL